MAPGPIIGGKGGLGDFVQRIMAARQSEMAATPDSQPQPPQGGLYDLFGGGGLAARKPGATPAKPTPLPRVGASPEATPAPKSPMPSGGFVPVPAPRREQTNPAVPPQASMPGNMMASGQPNVNFQQLIMSLFGNPEFQASWRDYMASQPQAPNRGYRPLGGV